MSMVPGKTIDIPAGTGRCKGLTGRELLKCKSQQIVRDSIKKQEKQGGGSGKAVPAGLNKETIDSILGSKEDWQKAIDENYCIGFIPLPCPMLALFAGALLVLFITMR